MNAIATPPFNTDSVIQQLKQIVADDQITPWASLTDAARSPLQSALVPTCQPACVVFPQTQTELAEFVACAHHNRWRILPYGSGTKLHWGGLSDQIAIALSTTRLNRLIDHAVGDLTVTAEAGMTLATLQGILARGNQFLTVDPSYGDRATLGGIVATADTGSLRQRYNGVRDLLIGISFVRSDGKLTQAGGRVVKNVAGYDLMKLLTGSWGTLGVISQLTFRIYPLPPASQTVVLFGETVGKAIAAIRASGLSPVALDCLTPTLTQELSLGSGSVINSSVINSSVINSSVTNSSVINSSAIICQFQTLDVSIATQTEQLIAIGEACGLQAIALTGAAETELWSKLRSCHESPTAIACKLGLLPTKLEEALGRIQTELPGAIALFHAGSGLGWLNWQDPNPQSLLVPILKLRQFCQQNGGFLSVLNAPIELRQTMDLWGYNGNAIALMRGIKQQFDAENILSPGRFIC
jgi:glycolate oxidase FAD binding subunit